MATTDTTKNRDKVIREDLSFSESLRRNIYEAGHIILASLVGLTLLVPQLFEIIALVFVGIYLVHRKMPFPEGRSSFGSAQNGSTPRHCIFFF